LQLQIIVDFSQKDLKILDIVNNDRAFNILLISIIDGFAKNPELLNNILNIYVTSASNISGTFIW
jgi:hypothetical protein